MTVAVPLTIILVVMAGSLLRGLAEETAGRKRRRGRDSRGQPDPATEDPPPGEGSSPATPTGD